MTFPIARNARIANAARMAGAAREGDDAQDGPVARALEGAARELRALDAIVASPEGSGPAACAALVRAWYEVAALDAALRGAAMPPIADFVARLGRETVAGGPDAALAPGDADRLAIVGAAAVPPPAPSAWPSARAFFRQRHVIVTWADALAAEARARGHRRPSRRAIVAAAVAIVAAAGLFAALHRPPVWRVVYYRTTELTEPGASDLVGTVGANWGRISPHRDVAADRFSARWDTCMVLDRPHAFSFVLGSDDGSRLIVDGKTVIDQWRGQAYTEEKASLDLAPGTHSLRVEYFQVGGDAELSLAARLDGKGEPRPLPRSLLRAPKAGDTPCAK